MKPTAVVLIATLLFQILVPGISIAAKKGQEKQIDGIISPSDDHRAAENAARIIWLLYEMDIWVMDRPNLDPSKITKGFYAHVIHTNEGAIDTTTGVIYDSNPDGFGIKTTVQFPEREKVLYTDIDTLVVARDRRAFDRWRRRAQGRFLVMSQSNLELSKLKKGWQAYVVSKFEDGTRTELTEITGLEEEFVVVRSNYGGGDQFWADGKIAHDDIILIVAAEMRGDITKLKDARQIIQHLTLNPRIRFDASRFTNRGTETKSIVGRLLDVNQDTLIVGAGLSRHQAFRVPISSIDDFEINIGRHRNTDKGIKIGLVLGLGALAPIAYLDSRSSGGWKWYATAFAACYISLPIFICSTLIGAGIESDRWVDVPTNRLNLSVAPTRNRGLGAALTFKF